MQQQTLFSEIPQTAAGLWSDKVMSHNTNETQLIANIIKLHNNGQPFDLDPTYSLGQIWLGLPQPHHKFDLQPQVADCRQADARALPFDDQFLNSIMFDPPFLIKSGRTGKIQNRFGTYLNYKTLIQFYREALTEFWRILKPNGILAFKCQDFVSGGQQHWTHFQIFNDATTIGYRLKDLFVLTRPNVLWSPNMKNQRHARKNHCYYLVFQKPKRA